jgi:hypothetical protein
MAPFNTCGYSQHTPRPLPTSTYIAQALDLQTQSSGWGYDSIDPQSDGSFAAGPDPEWFTDFILYDSDDPFIPADPLHGPSTGRTPATIPLRASPPRPALASTHAGVLDNAGSYLSPCLIDIDADYAVEPHDNTLDLEWNPTVPGLGLSSTSHSETTGESSQQSSPTQYISTQSDVEGRVSVPRLRFLKCPACQSQYSSKHRLQ